MSQPIPSTTPDTDYRGKVRDRDPDTSWDAAAGQTRTKTWFLREEVYAILEHHGPMTDDELFAFRETLRSTRPDDHSPATPQSVRSRRSELHYLGRVVWTGDKRPSANGHPSNLWAVAP